MNRLLKRFAAVLLTVMMLLFILSSCDSEVTTEQADVSADVQPAASADVYTYADRVFTARYNSSYSFNPITGTNPDNMALIPLLYEGLFVLDENWTPQPVLCESYETTDGGLTYTFHLKSDIAMSDGSTLTAMDVRYTLERAMEGGRFSGRLHNIDSVTAVDELTVEITLKTASYKLPVILDVPIIKANSIDYNHPPGTGPYYYQGTGHPRLSAFSAHRDYDSLPVQTVYLKECSNIELSVEFSSQAVDIFWDDPADSSEINILSDHEVRYYHTNILQFVGFNAANNVLSEAAMRRALGLTIDRDALVDMLYTNHADPAPLIMNPNYPLYDTAWEVDVSDPLAEISSIFSSLGLSDVNSDGYLEYPDEDYTYTPFTLKFIVNGDNKYKVAAAEEIALSMKTVGIDVEIAQLSWEAYKTALEIGNFDMYYGDVSLPDDYDLSQLLTPDGSIDYGHIGNTSYSYYLEALLAANDENAEKEAARQLCAYAYEDAPIIPVLYRQYAVHTNRNTVGGLTPTQSSLFYNFTDWTISLSQ